MTSSTDDNYLSLPPGSDRLSVSVPGHETFERDVTVIAAARTS